MAVEIVGEDGGMVRITKELDSFSKAVIGYKPAADLLNRTSVRAALQQADEYVDREAGRYPDNVMVRGAAPILKQKLRDLVKQYARQAQR